MDAEERKEWAKKDRRFLVGVWTVTVLLALLFSFSVYSGCRDPEAEQAETPAEPRGGGLLSGGPGDPGGGGG